MTGMTLVEALNSGKRFKRLSWAFWTDGKNPSNSFSSESVLANDYILLEDDPPISNEIIKEIDYAIYRSMINLKKINNYQNGFFDGAKWAYEKYAIKEQRKVYKIKIRGGVFCPDLNDFDMQDLYDVEIPK